MRSLAHVPTTERLRRHTEAQQQLAEQEQVKLLQERLAREQQQRNQSAAAGTASTDVSSSATPSDDTASSSSASSAAASPAARSPQSTTTTIQPSPSAASSASPASTAPASLFFFPGIEPGSAIHGALSELRASSATMAACKPVAQGGSDHNNHFHLHLHNYLASHSNTVAMSSRMVACDRAIESMRPETDRLFNDPLAAALAGPELMEKALHRHKEVEQRMKRPATTTTEPAAATGRRMGPETNPLATPRVAIRTRFFDDFITFVASQHPVHLRQLMLLGCGMDSRAYRLNCLESKGQVCCVVYELDAADVLRYKNSTIQSMNDAPEIKCRRRITVPVDAHSADFITVTAQLAAEPDTDSESPTPAAKSAPTVQLSPWSMSLLSHYHFQPHIPSVWLLEGNLMYLSPTQQLAVLHNISYLSCIGSFLAFSHINARALMNVQRTGNSWGMLQSTFQSCLDQDFLSAMEAGGWEIMKCTQLGASDASYGRWQAPVYGMDDPTHGVTVFVCAVKVRAMKVAGKEVDQRLDVKATLAMAEGGATAAESTDEDTNSSAGGMEEDEIAAASESDDDEDDGPSLAVASSQRHLLLDRPDEARSWRERVIDSWNQRAHSYDALLQQQPLFTTLAHRLLDLLPLAHTSDTLSFRAIDLACGTGCAGDALLSRYPKARVHLIDPATSMLNMARSSLAAKYGSTALLSCDMLRMDDIHILGTSYDFQPVDAIVCNVSMHLCREQDVYSGIAQLLADGGSFVYNLWGHAWADLAEREEEESWKWKRLVNQSLIEHKEPPTYLHAHRPQSGQRAVPANGLRSFSVLSTVAAAHGLVVDEMVLDCDEVSCELMIDFAAMSDRWLARLGMEKRQRVLARARQLGSEERMRVQTVRVKVTKPA